MGSYSLKTVKTAVKLGSTKIEKILKMGRYSLKTVKTAVKLESTKIEKI